MHDAAKGSERALARRNGGLATKKQHFADASMLPKSIRRVDDVFALLNYTLLETIGLEFHTARAASGFDCTRFC